MKKKKNCTPTKMIKTSTCWCDKDIFNFYLVFFWWYLFDFLFCQPEASNVLEDVSTEEHSDFFIEITVSDPQKIGEGMGSYLAYK